MKFRDELNDVIDFVIERENECYKNNCSHLGGYRIRGKRSYYKLQDELKKVQPDDSTLGRTFNLDRNESYRMLSYTGLPTVIATLPVVVGLSGVFLSMVPLILGIGQEVTPEVQKFTDSVLKFLENSGNFALASGKIAVKTLPLPLAAGAIAIVKTEIEKAKAEKRKKIEQDMAEIRETVDFITDLKRDKNDGSLNFIKEFLSNVDITKNSDDYNLDLLDYLIDYRNAVISEKGKEVRRNSTERFVDFVDFLSDSTTKDGASSLFINSTYVNNLVRLYGHRQVERDMVSRRK